MRDEADQARRMARFGEREDENKTTSFGERRNLRQEQRRGSRPNQSQQTSGRKLNIQTEILSSKKWLPSPNSQFAIRTQFSSKKSKRHEKYLLKVF